MGYCVIVDLLRGTIISGPAINIKTYIIPYFY